MLSNVDWKSVLRKIFHTWSKINPRSRSSLGHLWKNGTISPQWQKKQPPGWWSGFVIMTGWNLLNPGFQKTDWKQAVLKLMTTSLRASSCLTKIIKISILLISKSLIIIDLDQPLSDDRQSRLSKDNSLSLTPSSSLPGLYSLIITKIINQMP